MELSYLFEAHCTRTYEGVHVVGKLCIKNQDLIFESNNTQIDTIPLPIIQGVSIHLEGPDETHFVELRVLTLYGLAIYYGSSRSLHNLYSMIQSALQKHNRKASSEIHERNLLFCTCTSHSIYDTSQKKHSILLTSTHLYIFGYLRGPHIKISIKQIQFLQIRGMWRRLYIGFIKDPNQPLSSNEDLSEPIEFQKEKKDNPIENWVFEGPEAMQIYAYLHLLHKNPSSQIVLTWECTVKTSSLYPNKIPYKAICIVSENHFICVPKDPWYGLFQYKIINYELIQVSQLQFSSQNLRFVFDDNLVLDCLNGEYNLIKIKKLSTLINMQSHDDLYTYWDTKKIYPISCTGWNRISGHIQSMISREEQKNSVEKNSVEKNTTSSMDQNNVIQFPTSSNSKSELLFFSTAIWTPDREIQFGWLAVIGENLIFYPRNQALDIRIISQKYLYRNDDGDTSKHVLALRIEEEHFLIQQKEMTQLQQQQRKKLGTKSITKTLSELEKIRIQKQLTSQEFWSIESNIGESLNEHFFSLLPIPHRRLLWKNWSARHRREVLHNSFCKLTKKYRFQEISQTQICEGILHITSEGLHLQPKKGSLTNASLVDVEIASFNGRYRFQSSIYRLDDRLTPDFFIHPPKYMELTSQRAVTRYPRSGKVVALFLIYNNENGTLTSTEHVEEFEIRDISERGIGLWGNRFIPNDQYVLIDIPSTIGIIQIQAQKKYHLTLQKRTHNILEENKGQYEYCYGFEFHIHSISTQKHIEAFISDVEEHQYYDTSSST